MSVCCNNVNVVFCFRLRRLGYNSRPSCKARGRRGNAGDGAGDTDVAFEENTLRNAKRWAAGRGGGYPAAAAALFVATLVRMELHPIFQANSPFVTYLIGAFLIEFYFGLGPSLVVALGGVLIGVFFFVPPFGELLMPELGDLVFVIGYVVVALLGIVLIETLQRSRYELRLLREVAQARLEMLERSRVERADAIEVARTSDRRYRELAARASAVMYMRRLDGNFEYLNDEFYALTGLDHGALDGETWARAVHPDDLAAQQSQWREVAMTGEEQESSFRIRGADGRYRLFAGSVRCLEDKRGKIIRWSGSPVADADASIATTAS